MPNVSLLIDFYSSGLGSLFGTSVIAGILGLMIFFIIAYKFQLPPILIMLVMGIAGYFLAYSVLGDWVKALILIAFGVVIATLGYKLLYNGY